MWWRALGLEPTANKEEVKKAYSDLIKTIDQDTDIDQFTNVHRAYRLALKSFRQEEKKAPNPEGLVDYDGQTHWYLVELANIYNNPKRRLRTSAWEDLFACMSFIEEKHFLSEYVSFFNEHYALTEDIWAIVEKYYPLSNRKNFRWPEIVSGHLNIKASEIEAMAFDEASNYVTYKIHVFYGILDGDYDRALIFLRMLLDKYNRPELNRWYMVIATELSMEDDVDKAYKRMEADGEGAMATYYRCGYLNRKGQFMEAAGIIRQSPEGMKGSALKVLASEQAYKMGSTKSPDLQLMPWLSLDSTPVKEQKVLAKGGYSGDGGSGAKTGLKRFRLFGGKNR